MVESHTKRKKINLIRSLQTNYLWRQHICRTVGSKNLFLNPNTKLPLSRTNISFSYPLFLLIVLFSSLIKSSFISINIYLNQLGLHSTYGSPSARQIQYEQKAKWSSWEGFKGKSKEDCMALYVEEWEKQKVEYNK